MSIWFAAPIDQFPDYNKVTTVPASTNVDAEFPAANLLNYDPTKVMRMTATSGVITWDLGSSRSFDVISLIHTNLDVTSTILVEASLDNVSWTTLVSGRALAHVVDPVTDTHRKNLLRRNLTLFNSTTLRTFRYLRITVNSQVTLLHPSIGRLFVGTKFSPSTGWQYGSSFNFIDPSRRDRTDRGALILDPADPIIAAAVKTEFLSKNEMYDFIWEFNYWRGAGREFLACLDAEDVLRLQKNTLYCTIAEGRQITHDAFNAHSQTWILESIA